MSECKHGLRTGCSYCHADAKTSTRPPREKKPTGSSRLAEQMNERMTALRRRLRELRGEEESLPPSPSA